MVILAEGWIKVQCGGLSLLAVELAT